ncbi:MAG: patatin-like phospholipase family protein [Alphaproteobacteria bacterium]|nr:patatin-like phospholipase family protein [Alphaproteobacteria bacterium]
MIGHKALLANLVGISLVITPCFLKASPHSQERNNEERGSRRITTIYPEAIGSFSGSTTNINKEYKNYKGKEKISNDEESISYTDSSGSITFPRTYMDSTNDHESSSQKKAYVLSIDGGGIRGIIPAYVLQHLEEELNLVLKKRIRDEINRELKQSILHDELEKWNTFLPECIDIPIEARLAQVFDFMAGTSIGGIIVLGLNVPSDEDAKMARHAASKLF